MMNILPADTFIVYSKTVFSDQDRRLIMMLYQPIIGSVATNLYMTLWSYLDKNESKSLEWTHHSLMSSMQLKLESIASGREKLEGIGLIKSYVKKGNINSYNYELFSPISASDFFNNPILATTLYNYVGKINYDKILSFFKVVSNDISDYEEVTCKFHEVFETTNDVICEEYDDIEKNTRLGIMITPNFNLNNILTMIPSDMLNYSSVTKDTKELIYKLSFIYNFKENEIVNIIRNSIDCKHSIDKDLLRSNCRKFYNLENKGKMPNLVYKSQPEYLRKNVDGTSKKDQVIHKFETTSPYQFLVIKNNNTKPTRNELKIVEYLLVDLNLNPGVVNVLIDYVLRVNDNKLVKGFVETVAGQWVRNNIETVSDAIKLASREYKNKTSYSKTKSKVAVEPPEWFDKNNQESVASLEEQKSFEERMMKLRGEL